MRWRIISWRHALPYNENWIISNFSYWIFKIKFWIMYKLNLFNRLLQSYFNYFSFSTCISEYRTSQRTSCIAFTTRGFCTSTSTSCTTRTSSRRRSQPPRSTPLRYYTYKWTIVCHYSQYPYTGVSISYTLLTSHISTIYKWDSEHRCFSIRYAMSVTLYILIDCKYY